MSERLNQVLNRLRQRGRAFPKDRSSNLDGAARATARVHVFTDSEAGQIGGVIYRKGLEAIERGELRRAARCFGRAARHWPEVGWFAYRLGSVLAAMGCHDDADRIFAEGHRLRVTPDLVTDTRILLIGPKHFAALDRAVTDPEASMIGEGVAKTPATALLFLTADASYFKLYADAAIASALANGGIELACHVHIVNPDDDAIGEETRIARRHPGRAVSFSHESTDLSRRSETECRVYYACRRFQLLPAILRRSGGPVIVADIDQLVVGSLDPVLTMVREADAGLIQFSGVAYASPLATISASAVIAAATAGARRYFDLVAAYVAYCLERDLWMWHLDQAALFAVKLMIESQCEPVRIRPLGPRILESTIFDAAASGEPAPGTIFWSVTHSLSSNAEKRRLDLFQRYRSA